MTPIKDYIAKLFLYNTFHFKCNCIVPLDIVGVVKDYEISGSEIVLLVESHGKIYHVGLNTPSLIIDKL